MPAARNTTHVASATDDVEAATSNDASPVAAGPLVQRITREATVQMRRRLGLAERARLPRGIKHLIDAAARDIVESALEVAVTREVTETAKRLAHASRRGTVSPAPSDLPLLDEGLNPSDLPRPLLVEASELADKKNALEAAGFSSEEAMRILVAKIAAGGY